MRKNQTCVAETQKKVEPLRLLEQEPVRQHKQTPVQPVTPQAAYHRTQVNCNGLKPADFLALQRTMGNRKVQRIMAQRIDLLNGPQQRIHSEAKSGIRVQTKLKIGALNDIYELKSDHRSEQVMTMSQQSIQRHLTLTPAAQPML